MKASRCNPGEIAELVQKQDDSAMDRIVHCYLDALLGVGRCACRDPEAAADAVNDALLSAMERLGQFRGDGTVKAWLSRMVVNACRCQERGRKNDPSWNQPLDENDKAGGPTPQTAAAHGQLAGRLRAAMGTLKAEDQELFMLSQVGEASAPELAELLETTPAAVRARLTRLRRRLRRELEDVWQDWNDPANHST